MRLCVLLGCVAAASACDPQRDGRWIVRQGEHAAEAAHVLGIGVDKLTDANELQDPDLIYAGNTYTVPYVASLKPPATWNIKPVTTGTKSGCLAYLELGQSTTFMTQTKTASNGGATPLSTQSAGPPPVTSLASSSDPATGKSSASDTGAGQGPERKTTTERDHQASNSVGSGSTTSPGRPPSQPAATSETPSMTDCTSQSLPSCPSVVQTSPAASGSSTPSPTSGSEPLCVVEEIAGRRGTIAEHKQAHLADVFCKEAKSKLSRTNPAKLAYYHWRDEEKDTAYYFYSLHWTGWDTSCPAEETVDTARCLDVMTQNYKKCKSAFVEKG